MGGMTRLLLLLLWVGVTVSAAVDLQERIYGGKDCPPKERPYHVKFTHSGKLYCGGSLISDSWILTAAHCRELLPTAVLDAQSGPGRPVSIENFHKMYEEKEHDIMLLKLRKPSGIKPVDLPTKKECDNRKKILSFQIAGHTITTLDSKNKPVTKESATLQCADMDAVDCQFYMNCMKGNQPNFYKKKSFQHLLCAESSVAISTQGDSGGGVVHNGKIYGVISFGDDVPSCSSFDAYMDVCEYLPWIKKTAGIP